MLPDFNRLKVFYYVYSEMSVMKGAQILNVTQSAVSQHLKKLENEIGSQLFTRVHKKLIPTYEGEKLFKILHPFFHELQNGLEHIKETRVKPSGLLRIGAPSEFGKMHMPEIIAGFRKRYPDVTFTMTLGNPDHIIDSLNKGKLDFALIDTFFKEKDISGIYSIEPVIDEEVVLITSRDYYNEVLKKDISFKNIVKREYITFHPNATILKTWYKYHFNKMVSDFNLVLTVDSVLGLISGVKSDLGMGVMASHLVYEDIQKGDIIPIRTGKNEIVNRISLLQLQDKIPNLTEKTFQKHFMDFMKNEEIIKRFTKL